MKPTAEQLRLLLDIPEQLEALDRTHNGLKSDKAKKVRELDAIEARHRLKISKEGGYTNAEDRKAALIIALEDDVKYAGGRDRLEALDGMIRANRAQYDVLRRQREGIKALTMQDFISRFEEALSDKDLVQAAGARWLA